MHFTLQTIDGYKENPTHQDYPFYSKFRAKSDNNYKKRLNSLLHKELVKADPGDFNAFFIKLYGFSYID